MNVCPIGNDNAVVRVIPSDKGEPDSASTLPGSNAHQITTRSESALRQCTHRPAPLSPTGVL